MRFVDRHADVPSDVLSLLIAVRVAAADAVPSASIWWMTLTATPTAATVAAVSAQMTESLSRIHALAPTSAVTDAHVARAVKDLTEPPVDDLADLIGGTVLGSVRQQQRTGQFFTPSALANMMAAMNPAGAGMYIADPACGAGVLLVAAHREATARLGAAASTITYLGVDLDGRCARAAGLVLWSAGLYEQSHIFCADALTHAFAGVDAHGQLRVLDMHVMLGNPPFGTRTETPSGQMQPLIVPPEVLWRQWPRALLGDADALREAFETQRLLRQ